MAKKTNLLLLSLAAMLLVLLMVLSHQNKREEMEHAVLVDFVALVPADGMVELNRDAPPPGKQFAGEDAVAVVLDVQNAGLVPYSGPKHTPAPGHSWSIRCTDGLGNDLFVLYLDRNEIEYYSFTDEQDAMYYSLATEDLDALDAKLEQLYNNG